MPKSYVSLRIFCNHNSSHVEYLGIAQLYKLLIIYLPQRGQSVWLVRLKFYLYIVHCILFSVVFAPSPPSHRGSVWVLSYLSSLYS
jgi:hypothetical protein